MHTDIEHKEELIFKRNIAQKLEFVLYREMVHKSSTHFIAHKFKNIYI